MNTEIWLALQILLMIVISYPLGKSISPGVYKEGNDCMRFMVRLIYLQTGGYQLKRYWKVFQNCYYKRIF